MMMTREERKRWQEELRASNQQLLADIAERRTQLDLVEMPVVARSVPQIAHKTTDNSSDTAMSDDVYVGDDAPLTDQQMHTLAQTLALFKADIMEQVTALLSGEPNASVRSLDAARKRLAGRTS